MISQGKYVRFPEGKTKAVTLSYDDGVEQDKRLIEILKKYQMKATFNISCGCMAEEGCVYKKGEIFRRMSLHQCKETYTRDICEVATHGFTHPYLTELETVMVMDQIVCDRIGLEETFGAIISGHAYPYGSNNDKVAEVLKLAGIDYARTVYSSETFGMPEDWLMWKPTCHHDNPKLTELTDKFLQKEVKQEVQLFYLWGHTHELEENNNWSVIEEFCKKMSGREDIWYATNKEIYEYMESYRHLRYSANGKMIYNPTCSDVWVEIDGEVHKVGVGEKNTLNFRK